MKKFINIVEGAVTAAMHCASGISLEKIMESMGDWGDYRKLQ